MSQIFTGAARILIAAAALWQYSSASSAGLEQVRWLLEPTACLVSFMLGQPFIEFAGGFDFTGAGFVIAPQCAGLRFFVIALLGGLVVSARAAEGALNLLRTVASAYLATLAANAARIISTLIALAAVPHVPQSALHAGMGVSVYFFFLVVYLYLVGGFHDGSTVTRA